MAKVLRRCGHDSPGALFFGRSKKLLVLDVAEVPVDTMYVDDQTHRRGRKIYRRVLLRTSFRVNGTVQHRTIANISHCSAEEITALKWALKNKGSIEGIDSVGGSLKVRQGPSVGAVWVLHKIAERLGITKALGKDRDARLSLLMVLATVIGRNSRLSIVRSAEAHAFCDVMGLDAFDEDSLYSAMDWLCENQADIEAALFRGRYGGAPPVLYLYDVTSSYLEGDQNELAAYGYNRDKKSGKKQIVIGLLTDDQGLPLSVEVFRGNTADVSTFNGQIAKLKERFGVERVAVVGDRGMIKSVQIGTLNAVGMNYITAITKVQVCSLLEKGVLQMEMFDDELMEVEDGAIRYVLRRNPTRASEIERSRRGKLATVERLVAERNTYLAERERAEPDAALKRVAAKIEKLRIGKWLLATVVGRTLSLRTEEERLREEARLDGCYVIKSDLKSEDADKETIHDRYKSLSQVEWGFRSMKSPFLELRGIFVRKEERTRAHVFVVMLAYLLNCELRKCWRGIEVTVEEGVRELASICSMKVSYAGMAEFQTIPEPRALGLALLNAAGITLPDAIPSRNVRVATRKKLVPERKVAANA